MTKITTGIEIAKIDSLTLKVRQEQCTVNNSDITEIIQFSRKDTGEYKGERRLFSDHFEIEGVMTKVELSTEQNGVEKATPIWKIATNAKQLGTQKYNEGLTLDNIQDLLEKIQQKTGIHFEQDALINARFEDVDICYDRECSPEDWHRYNLEIMEQITPETWNTYGLKFTHKSPDKPVLRKLKPGELISGIQLNDRKKQGTRTVNVSHPFAKHYNSALDKAIKIANGEKSLPGYDAGTRNRQEAQIRNPYWESDQILKQVTKPLLFKQLLEIQKYQNAVLADYVTGIVIRKYTDSQKPARPKIQRDMSKETPREFVTNELFQIVSDIIQGKMNPTSEAAIKEILKARASKAFHKQKAYEIKKIVDEMYDLIMPQTDPNQTNLKL